MKKYLLILLAAASSAFGQTTTPTPGTFVRQVRQTVGNYNASNVSLFTLTNQGQEFVNFGIVNPITGINGCPDLAPWDNTFGYDAVNDTIGVLNVPWSLLSSVPSTFAPSAHTHPWSQITSTPTTLSGYGITDSVVLTSGTYADPSWLTSLAWSKLTGVPSTFTPSAHTHPWSQITSTPTTLSGYGITDAYPSSNPNSFINISAARGAISLTTTGTSGVATYNSSTGVLNIPNYAPGAGTVTSVGITSSNLTVSGSPVTTSGSIAISLPNTGTAGTYASVTTDAQGRVTAGTNWSFAGGNGQQLSRTIQTTAAAANGWQISASRPAFVSYSGTIQSTSSLSGGAAGALLLEVAATNSTVASDWKEIARTADGQTNGLIVGLGLNMVGGGCISGIVPPGYYVRVRSVNTTGTSTYTYNSGQEVTM